MRVNPSCLILQGHHLADFCTGAGDDADRASCFELELVEIEIAIGEQDDIALSRIFGAACRDDHIIIRNCALGNGHRTAGLLRHDRGDRCCYYRIFGIAERCWGKTGSGCGKRRACSA